VTLVSASLTLEVEHFAQIGSASIAFGDLTVPVGPWVIIEEPEMGLHPQGLSAVLLLVLELLWRGYRVVLSTHAPLVLDLAFALRHLRGLPEGPRALARAFGIERLATDVRKVMEKALAADVRIHYLQHDNVGAFNAVNISGLDPAADEPAESGWGGLTEFSSRFQDAIAATRAGAEG
jgi:hypothetical protein